MESIKKTVRVTITKEISIELTPKMFGDMTLEEYLAEFRSCFWDVESIDGVIEYAAEMAAIFKGGHEHDGLGLLDQAGFGKEPDVIFDILDEERDIEIIDAVHKEV